MGLQNTMTASLQSGKTSPLPKSVLFVILNNLMVAVILELWGKCSTPSMPLLPGTLWPGVVAPDRILSMGQIKLFNI